MNDLADSRRNMKIDLRPRAVMRIMRFELFVALFSLSACIMMPLYFYKIKNYRERHNEKYNEIKEQQLQEKLEKQRKEEQSYLRRNKEQ